MRTKLQGLLGILCLAMLRESEGWTTIYLLAGGILWTYPLFLSPKAEETVYGARDWRNWVRLVLGDNCPHDIPDDELRKQVINSWDNLQVKADRLERENADLIKQSHP